MRSCECRAAHDEFDELSASKFDFHPTKFLTKEAMDMINNEMKDEVRRKNWLNEARAQVILFRQYQGEPTRVNHMIGHSKIHGYSIPMKNKHERWNNAMQL